MISEFEEKYWAQNISVGGIDEAGRGPMAGPCVVAGVVFPQGFYHPLITDSKKLSAQKRQELVDIIKANALMTSIKLVSVEEIDRLNIYQATKQAMEEVALILPAEVVLTDAMPLESVAKAKSIIKGDARSMTIAAASILAKTTRDQIMEELDREYPLYGFKQHKGYGTKKHREAIEKYGRCPVHRSSFRFKDEDQISLDI